MVQIFPGKLKFKIEKVYYLSSYSLFYRTFNLELKIRAFFSFRLWSYNQNINFFQKFRSWLKVGACWDKDQTVKSVCFMSLKGLLMKLKSLFERMCCMKNPQLEFINFRKKKRNTRHFLRQMIKGYCSESYKPLFK